MKKPNFEDILGIQERDYLEYFNKQHLDIVGASKEYGRQMWNAALEWAVVNAKIIKERKITELPSFNHKEYEEIIVDKNSILKGKINE